MCCMLAKNNLSLKLIVFKTYLKCQAWKNVSYGGSKW
jgi:hypothetical protein